MGGQVWLTTATIDGHDFFAIGLDADTGGILFNEKVFHSDNPEPLGNGASMNCYATPSPVIEPGRVYVHFGSFGTACLDTRTAKSLWKRDDLPCRHYRGPASSPVLFENLLILTFDGADLQYLVALDKKTGQTVWKTDRSVAWNDENEPGQMAREGDLPQSPQHAPDRHRRRPAHHAQRRRQGRLRLRPPQRPRTLEGPLPRLLRRPQPAL